MRSVPSHSASLSSEATLHTESSGRRIQNVMLACVLTFLVGEMSRNARDEASHATSNNEG